MSSELFEQKANSYVQKKQIKNLAVVCIPVGTKGVWECNREPSESSRF